MDRVKLILLVLFTLSFSSLAQDQKFFNDFLFSKEKVKKEDKIPKISVDSNLYKIDLNADGKDEGILLSKQDGIDFLSIWNSSGEKLFSSRFQSKGGDSKIDKISIKSVGNNEAVLIIYFYEGMIDSTRFEGSARLYFISFKQKDLSSFKMYTGPSYFHELEKAREQYILRSYFVDVLDLNQDGYKDILVEYAGIKRVYLYLGNGAFEKI